MTPPMLCIVILQGMRIRSAHYTYDDAKEQAHRMYLSTPCEIMLLVRDDQQRVIGVQQLTRAEQRELGRWKPRITIRAEDIVPHEHKLDKFIVRKPIDHDNDERTRDVLMRSRDL